MSKPTVRNSALALTQVLGLVLGSATALSGCGTPDAGFEASGDAVGGISGASKPYGNDSIAGALGGAGGGAAGSLSPSPTGGGYGAATAGGAGSPMGGEGDGASAANGASSASQVDAASGTNARGPFGFTCPGAPYENPVPDDARATRVPGAPPEDDFNPNNFSNLGGPVWLADSLYFSEMQSGNSRPLARILKLTQAGQVTVALADSGSNGLAVDESGVLFAAVHKDGSISRVSLPSGPIVPVIDSYDDVRFNSPEDLAIRSDGTIYFSDPSYQNGANPQAGERLYWVTPAPARTVTAVTDGVPGAPTGVTLSPDEKTLYVSGDALRKFEVMTSGSLGPGSDFVVGGGGDGMVVDCAGNLYVAGNPGTGIRVYAPNGGTPIATIAVDAGGAMPTNVAFGGNDHTVLYITVQGNAGQRGVFSVRLNVPGFPY